ncbi:hypothetical protein ACWD5Q_01150 [Streptomyces sp. NPDC002513]
MTTEARDAVTADGDHDLLGYGDWAPDDAEHDGGDSGPIRDLAAFHGRLAGADAALCGPNGQALVPVCLLGTIGRLRTGTGWVARKSDIETVSILPVLDDVAVIRLRATPRTGDEADPHSAVELGRLRLAWSRQLFKAAASHLAGRSNSSGRLLDQQLVKGALADATIGQWETEAVLAEAQADFGDLALLHDRITETDRILLRLLGAHGFTVASPGRTAHLSELLANTYIERADHDRT